jgi:hypothetical protein
MKKPPKPTGIYPAATIVAATRLVTKKTTATKETKSNGAAGAKARAKKADTTNPGHKKQAELLLDIIEAEAKLFRSRDGHGAFASMTVDNHRESWPIGSRGFQNWLRARYYDLHARTVPNREAFSNAMAMVEAHATRAPEIPTYLRCASADGKIYIDLCDSLWRIIEVSREGYRILGASPVVFRRSPSMSELPAPTSGGSIDDLRRFVNCSEEDFVLLVGAMVTALRGQMPFPIVAVAGVQGSGKTGVTMIYRSLIDPNQAPIRGMPRNEDNIDVAADNAYVLAFDNMSSIPGWLSDKFCQLSTGAGQTKRTLFRNRDQEVFYAARPLIINSIADIAERADMADRCIMLDLDAIAPSKRRDDREVREEFLAARPAILGALLDLLVVGLNELPTVKLIDPPRMIDTARWATACTMRHWHPEAFMKALRRKLDRSSHDIVEKSPIANVLLVLVDYEGAEWRGTPTQLYEELSNKVSPETRKARSWPDGVAAFGKELRRLIPSLQAAGLEVEESRTEAARTYRVARLQVKMPSLPSSPVNAVRK